MQQKQHPSDPNPQILWKLLVQQVPAKCSGRKKENPGKNGYRNNNNNKSSRPPRRKEEEAIWWWKKNRRRKRTNYVGNWQAHYVGNWVTNRGFGSRGI
jgi:hypothetical protein